MALIILGYPDLKSEILEFDERCKYFEKRNVEGHAEF